MAIQTGGRNCGFLYFDATDADWNLTTFKPDGASDYRRWYKDLTFPSSFSEVPTVILMLRSFEVLVGQPSRISLGFQNVDANGFELIVTTWGETSLAGVGVNWLAYDSASGI